MDAHAVGDSDDMADLWGIVQRHLDAYGVRAAALARRMGTSPQTLDSWKHRGVRALPRRHLLEALARETRTPYGDVLIAALRDAGYLPRGREGRDGQPAPIEVTPLVLDPEELRSAASQHTPRRPPR